MSHNTKPIIKFPQSAGRLATPVSTANIQSVNSCYNFNYNSRESFNQKAKSNAFIQNHLPANTPLNMEGKLPFD